MLKKVLLIVSVFGLGLSVGWVARRSPAAVLTPDSLSGEITISQPHTAEKPLVTLRPHAVRIDGKSVFVSPPPSESGAHATYHITTANGRVWIAATPTE